MTKHEHLPTPQATCPNPKFELLYPAGHGHGLPLFPPPPDYLLTSMESRSTTSPAVFSPFPTGISKTTAVTSVAQNGIITPSPSIHQTPVGSSTHAVVASIEKSGNEKDIAAKEKELSNLEAEEEDLENELAIAELRVSFLKYLLRIPIPSPIS